MAEKMSACLPKLTERNTTDIRNEDYAECKRRFVREGVVSFRGNLFVKNKRVGRTTQVMPQGRLIIGMRNVTFTPSGKGEVNVPTKKNRQAFK